jgi:hypothetical protein
MSKEMALRLDYRRAQKLARPIIEGRKMNARMIVTLAAFILAEARDVRTASLRKILNKRRHSVIMLRKRWAERCDADPELEREIYQAVDALRDEVPA